MSLQTLPNALLAHPPIQQPITVEPTFFATMPWSSWFTKLFGRANRTPPWIEDTHLHRASYDPRNSLSTYAVYPSSGGSPRLNVDGDLYYETDRNVFYRSLLVANVPTWVYFSGEMSTNQAGIPNDLGSNDAGFIVNVTDYQHRLRWSGTAWGWAPGDGGSAYMGLFEVDPTSGWHLYDGSAGVHYLKADGTTGSVNLPDLTATPCFLVGGGANSGPNGPTMPTLHSTAKTDTAVTGIPANTGVDGTSTAVQSGTGIFVAAHVHTHPITDPGHFHALSSANVTFDNPGAPENLVRRAWFRI